MRVRLISPAQPAAPRRPVAWLLIYTCARELTAHRRRVLAPICCGGVYSFFTSLGLQARPLRQLWRFPAKPADMRRYQEPAIGGGRASSAWDDGDDKSAAAKRHRRAPGGEEARGGGQWAFGPAAVGLPWGLTLCLLYLLLYTPHCPVSRCAMSPWRLETWRLFFFPPATVAQTRREGPEKDERVEMQRPPQYSAIIQHITVIQPSQVFLPGKALSLWPFAPRD